MDQSQEGPHGAGDNSKVDLAKVDKSKVDLAKADFSKNAGAKDERSRPESRAAAAPGSSVVSLQSALRRARLESAERSEAFSDIRDADGARLDILREHLAPIFAEVPADCDMFDLGLTPGEKPRLFVDMIAFVEMARDRRAYRFVQDTRSGRVLILQSESIDSIARAVADYIARRLVEREKALAADAAFGEPRTSGRSPTRVSARPAETATRSAVARAADPSGDAPPRARPRSLRILSRTFLFVIEALGSAAFFAALAAIAWWLWSQYAR